MSRNKITISEQDGVRYLHFGTVWVQGGMRVSRPYALEITYLRDMMAWLLLLDPPQRILQLGLGAGSLSKYCLRHCAPSRIDVVELDEQVVLAARQWFALPPDDERLRVILADAHAYLRGLRKGERAGEHYGVVQVDLYDRDARGPVYDSVEFYRDCRQMLGEAGVCCVNLFGEHESFARNCESLSEAFEGRVLLLPAIEEGNAIAVAVAGPRIDLTADDLLARARQLESQRKLPAVHWAHSFLEGEPRLQI